MDVSELRVKIREIEGALKLALNELEKESGCYVADIIMDRHPKMIGPGGHPPIAEIHIEVHAH